MRVLLSGATGFIGPVLVQRLLEAGHSCYVLSRNPKRARQDVPAEAVVLGYDQAWPAVDGVVNMAGENVAGLWTKGKRQRVLQSRVEVTRRIGQWMRQVSPPPSVLVSMSAVGIYGHRPGELLTEQAPPDPEHMFRAQVTLAWEEEARRAAAENGRLVIVRVANALHPAGGYLQPLLAVYRFMPLIVGLGSSWRHLSWISRHDTVRLLQYALENEQVEGVLNGSAPQPVTRAQFSRALGRALRKPVWLWSRVPDWMLQLALGEFSKAIIDSQYVVPQRVEQLGFHFDHRRLEPYLLQELAK
jgi:uncharacterized protein (TIGR01777 family)